METDFSERIHIRTLLFPNPEYNKAGIMETSIISVDEEHIIQQNPASFNTHITKGLSFSLSFVYKHENGTPHDLSTFNVEGRAYNTEEPEIGFDLKPIISEPEKGKITINLTPEETNNIPISLFSNLYKYYIDLVSQSGYRFRITIGILSLCY